MFYDMIIFIGYWVGIRAKNKDSDHELCFGLLADVSQIFFFALSSLHREEGYF